MSSAAFVLGLIPARGGSKGIPRKNIRLLQGRPLIVYTIEAALKSSWLSLVMTSTEDADIASIASAAGSAIIDRPPDLARDETPTLPVVEHAIEVVERDYQRPLDYVVVLQATTPFRTGEDIDRAGKLLVDTQADSVVSVRQVHNLHPQKLKRIDEDLRLLPYVEAEVEGIRRQDLPPVYIRNGGIYATRRDIVRQRSLYGRDIRAYVMPVERSIEIDSELDFLLAEVALQQGLIDPG